MGITSKITVSLMAAACVCAVNAAEIASVSAPTDFNQPKRISAENDVLVFKGKYAVLTAAKFLTLDPAKKYKLSGDFRAKEGTTPARVYLGLTPYDAKKKQIIPRYVNTVANTATEVAADAKKGSKVILVKDASAWNKKTPYGHIALNVKDDFSDLPNTNGVPIVKGGIKANGDVWEIELKKPLNADIPAGTKVRQHMDSGTNIYCTGSAVLKGNDWMTRTGTITGMAKATSPSKNFWPGTKFVRIMIICNGKSDSATEFKNIKLEEIE